MSSDGNQLPIIPRSVCVPLTPHEHAKLALSTTAAVFKNADGVAKISSLAIGILKIFGKAFAETCDLLKFTADCCIVGDVLNRFEMCTKIKPEMHWTEKAMRISFFVLRLLGIFYFLDKLKAINLQAWFAAIGNIPVIGTVFNALPIINFVGLAPCLFGMACSVRGLMQSHKYLQMLDFMINNNINEFPNEEVCINAGIEDDYELRITQEDVQEAQQEENTTSIDALDAMKKNFKIRTATLEGLRDAVHQEKIKNLLMIIELVTKVASVVLATAVFFGATVCAVGWPMILLVASTAVARIIYTKYLEAYNKFPISNNSGRGSVVHT